MNNFYITLSCHPGGSRDHGTGSSGIPAFAGMTA
jgi:hypothetical protein